MMYSLSVSVSNLHAMYQPVASIPKSGTVPAKVTGMALYEYREDMLYDKYRS